MNVIDAVLKGVKRDSDGFEDVHSFWAATDKLTYPLPNQVKANLHKTPLPRTTAPADDSEVEFNYDTSTTITDDEEDDDEEQESESDGDSDTNGSPGSGTGRLSGVSLRTDTSLRSFSKSRQSIMSTVSSVYSPLNQSLRSNGLSPLGTENSYRDSLATSNRDSIATSNRSGLNARNRSSTASSSRDVDASNRDSIVSSRRDTIESVQTSGRKSMASSRRESGLSEGGFNESGFDADRSADMDDMNNTAFTTAGGERSGSADTSRRSSVETAVEENAPADATATPATTRTARSERSLNLSAPSESALSKSGRQSLQGSSDPNRSARRVSFPDSLGGLSPIEGTNSQPASGSSRLNSKSRSSFGTSLADSGERSSAGRSHSSLGRSSVEGSEHFTPADENNNDFGEDYGGGDDPDEDVSRIMSQTDTPVANKSNRIGLTSASSSAMKTPYSEAGDSMRSSMSGHSRHLSLPTPGSNDFVRGTQLADETYMEQSGSGEEETDDEADTSAVITPAAGRKRSAGEEDVDSSALTEGDSFIDNSFIRTIHSSNKKYAEGRKALQEQVKPAIKGRGIKHKLYSSDEEENPGLQDTSEEDSEAGGNLRRSRRATKGRRFAFWKGERPRYEEGTMVGLIPAEPTPAKKRRTNQGVRGRTKTARAHEAGGALDDSVDEAALPPVVLPKNAQFIRRDQCEVLHAWDENTMEQTTAKVICPGETLIPTALPVTARRARGKQLTGSAAVAINTPEIPGVMSSWCTGFVDLLPQAVKDAEGVGRFMQVFYVVDCQQDGLEMGLAHPELPQYDERTAQRTLLRRGDFFCVPPGNIYRLENHSTAKAARLSYTIIKPIAQKRAGSRGQAHASLGSEDTVVPGMDEDEEDEYAEEESSEQVAESYVE